MKSFPLVVFMIASGFNAWGQPYALTNQHCDIRVVYQPDATNQLGFSIRDSDRAITYEPAEVILTATEASRLTLPGDFFVWQVGGTGALEFQMATTDGLNELDTIPLYPGGHSHHNWGFTSNGIVTVTFE